MNIDPPIVDRLRVEYGTAFGIGESRPRLSWVTRTIVPEWSQAAYEVQMDGQPQGRIDDDDSVFRPWPGPPLQSRERREVRVRVWGTDGSESRWSEPLEVEAGLLEPGDWSAKWITSVVDEDGRPQCFRRRFELLDAPARARLYATSAGINRLYLNGRPVGTSVLAPGWSAYGKRLHYETHDVTELLASGENVVCAVVADGWWRGHVGFEGKRHIYGDRVGLLLQLEIGTDGGTGETITSGHGWRTSAGPLLEADILHGETYDARLAAVGWTTTAFDDSTWAGATEFEPDVGDLVARQGPPVRRVEEIPVRRVLTTPSGRTVLDFGQNLVGWVRFTVEGEAGTVVTLRHAEVLEHGELGTRPLRKAKATDRYVLGGGGVETWEPSFTFHGFRYADVDGWPAVLDPSAFVAIAIHSDLERSGGFSCSNELLNQLHQNIVWGMRGNFVDIPTDCPQRDERLGWTGDIQVFAPTASFLYDVGGFLADWLEDLRANQSPDGAVPLVVPSEPFGPEPWFFVAAAWSDAAVLVPWTLYERYADVGLLERQFESMQEWVDFAHRKAGRRHLWPEEFQLGDWLDPDAPPDKPWRAKTDAVLVASAYLARSTQVLGDVAALLGRTEIAKEYRELAAAVREAFRAEYVAPSGRISSDTTTAYALAIAFELYEDAAQNQHAAERLAALAEADEYHISTGFVGTPLVLPALTALDDTRTAYRLLTEVSCPSWLYPVTMGATTVWERWDSLLPDGTINPGEMTSFNHYAFGAVADWMHQTVGGIAAASPGYRQFRISPVPGRGVTSASCWLRTAYGSASCQWSLVGRTMTVDAEIPPNTSATVILPGHDSAPLAIGAGGHHWTYEVADEVAALWVDDAQNPPQVARWSN